MPDEAAVLKGSGTSEQQAYQEFYGRVPRSVEVELTEELVDCCVPGEAAAWPCVRASRDLECSCRSHTPHP